MTGGDTAAPPFDIFSLTQDVRDRFGWSNEDLSRVMEQLLPAALNGFRYFGSTMPGFSEFPGNLTQPAAAASNPFAAFTGLFQDPSEAALMPFFGPEAVQKALAGQISALTGLRSDAIHEMMPVAATLAMGQIARPFVHGEARNLLDAYLRGFARGRPKPQPTPADYLQGYADAMQAFWGAFLQPASIVTKSPQNQNQNQNQNQSQSPSLKQWPAPRKKALLKPKPLSSRKWCPAGCPPGAIFRPASSRRSTASSRRPRKISAEFNRF